MGDTTYASVRQDFERRIKAGEFREVPHSGAGRQFTTTAMVHMEREIVSRMQEGNRRDYGDPMLVSPQVRIRTEERHPELSASQRQAVDDILISREKIVGLDGIAGAGKTTALAVVREGAEADGYRVEGFAPTSRAAQKLAEAGMETSTLQKHLARGQQPDTGGKRLYILDESSLASTRQVYEFVNRLHLNDRVLLVGDRRQHEAVEAGRPFAQLQDAGMKTVRLDEILRQKDPELKQVVEQLARGEVTTAPAWRLTSASMLSCRVAELSAARSTAFEPSFRARALPARIAPGPSGTKWATCCVIRAHRKRLASARENTRR
jgi:hypothetical protein